MKSIFAPHLNLRPGIEEMLSQLEASRATIRTTAASINFELPTPEECRAQNNEIVQRRMEPCHGCGRQFRRWGMLYFFKDNRDEMDWLCDKLVKGEITISDYNRQQEDLINASHPSDGYYCSRECYQTNSDGFKG